MSDEIAGRTAADFAERPTRVRWIVFALACSTSWMLYFHRYAWGMAKPFFVKEWGVSKEQLGQVDRVFASCYMIFQVPAGLVADIVGIRFFFTSCIGVWSLAILAMTLVTGVGGLYGSLGVLGMSQAGVYPSLSKVSKTWFPFSTRTTIQGWIGVFFGRMGAFSTNLIILTFLIGVLVLPWRTAVQIAASVGLVLMVLFFWFFRDSPRSHGRVNEAERRLIEGTTELSSSSAESSPLKNVPAERPSLWQSILTRNGINLLCLTLQTFLSTMADQFYVAWLVLFFNETFKPSTTMLGLVASLPLLGGAVGGVIGGFLNDQLTRRGLSRRWSRTVIGLVGKGMAGALMLGGAYGLMNNMYLMCVCLVLVKLFGDWSLASTWGTVTDIGGRFSATVFAFNNGVASLAPVVIATTMGRIVDVKGWPSLLIFVSAIYFACALSWLMINSERELFPDKN